jgi:uncharacterized spore protein YtfJ
MALKELVGGITDSSSVRRVFGDPIEKDGILVIPVASIRGGFGGGEGPAASSSADGSAAPASWGGGGAWSASPAGVYLLKNGEIEWEPAVDANRTVLLGCLTGIVSLLVLRSIVRTLSKRT